MHVVENTGDYQLGACVTYQQLLDYSDQEWLLCVLGSAPATPAPSTTSRDTQSPLTTSGQSSTLREMREAWKKRRGESAYDINNIVIPYSIASSTRVERLKYKEIETPK